MVDQHMILSSSELLDWRVGGKERGKIVRNSVLEVLAFSDSFVDSVVNNSMSWENCRTPCSQTNQAIQSYIKTQKLSVMMAR